MEIIEKIQMLIKAILAIIGSSFLLLLTSTILKRIIDKLF